MNLLSRRRFLQAAGVVASTGLWAACGDGTAIATGSNQELQRPSPLIPTGMDSGLMRPQGVPVYGGTLRTAFEATTSGFNLHRDGSAHVLSHMYNNLVRRNLVDGLRTIVPDLARRIEVSEDGQTFTFPLRAGVKFHDGTPLTSGDVLATFNHLAKITAGKNSPLKAELPFIEEFMAPDADTVVFRLAAPRATFLDALASPQAVIYSEKSLREHDFDLRKVVVPGTGAFMYVEHQPGVRWLFERNPDYWDAALPYIDRLEMWHVPALSSRGRSVLEQEADLSWNVALETWMEGKKREDISTAQLPNSGTSWLFPDNLPMWNSRVRGLNLHKRIFAEWGRMETVWLDT